MKNFKHNSKKYNFVNETEVDGIIYTAYRRPNKDMGKIIEVKNVKYIVWCSLSSGYEGISTVVIET